MITTVVVLAVAVLAFVSNRIAPPLVALGVALALFVTGTVTLPETIAGFGDPVVVYLAALYVVSEALDATGVTTWAGQQLIDRVGTGRRAVLTALMLLCAVLTALISVNGAVAALVPVAVMLATGIGQPSPQLLMPLAFAAHASSMLTLLGTPINVLVSELAVEAGARPFGPVGLRGTTCSIGTISPVRTAAPVATGHGLRRRWPGGLAGAPVEGAYSFPALFVDHGPGGSGLGRLT
jgi:H+/gluconate symporter-like permease